MSNYSSLKATINANIKQNGNGEITGPILNSVLNAMVDSLAGYHYSGIATPATNPGTPDNNVFYIASEAGAYTNFGSLAVAEGEVAILKYNGTWTKEVTGAATAAEVSQLSQEVNGAEEERAVAVASTREGYRIPRSGGVWTTATGYNIDSFAVDEGKTYHLLVPKMSSQYSAVYSFGILGQGQTALPSPVVQGPATNAEYDIVIPEGITALFVCYEVANGSPTLTTTVATEGLIDRVSELETNVGVISDELIEVENAEDADLLISDNDGHDLCEFSGGHIKTKYFDSSKIPNIVLAIKKAVFMGDSITQGVYSYWHNNIHNDANRYNGFDIVDLTDIAEETAYHGIHYYFGLLSGANVVNLGRRGSGWVADTRNIGNALEVATSYDFADVDFVALCFGVNDYIQGETIGDILEQTANTIIGNMCATIEKILTDNPLCKVVVYSPYNTWGQVSKGGDYVSNVLYGDESTNYALGYTINGNTLQDIINAMETVCMYYGIQCVNLSKSNVVNRFTLKNIMVDGLHPTKESYLKLAAEIYGKGNFGA